MGNERGASTVKTLLWLLVIGGGIHAFAKFMPPYMQNYKLSKLAEKTAVMRADPTTGNDVSMFLERQIRLNELPFEARDFQIVLDGGEAIVSVDWTYDVELIPANDFVPEYTRRLALRAEGRAPLR